MKDHPSKGADQNSPLGVGVWGIGPHARKNVLPAVAACSSTRLVGVTSRSTDLAREEALRYNCQFWDRPEDMLLSPEIDAVYLATPIGLHRSQGELVLTANKHLWCEKALAVSCTDVHELASIAAIRGLSLCETFMYLYHPQFARIRSLVVEQALGAVSSVVCRFGLPPLQNPGFRSSRDLGGGALLDVACYPLSLALHLCGDEPRILCSRVHRAPDSEVDTSGIAVLEFPSGSVAELEWGYNRAYVNDLTIWGDKSSLHADRVFSKSADYTSSIEIADLHGVRQVEEIAPTNSFVQMLHVFARSATDKQLQARLREEARRQALALEALKGE